MGVDSPMGLVCSVIHALLKRDGVMKSDEMLPIILPMEAVVKGVIVTP